MLTAHLHLCHTQSLTFAIGAQMSLVTASAAYNLFNILQHINGFITLASPTSNPPGTETPLGKTGSELRVDATPTPA
jgi:hypothetical protein